MIVDDNGNSFIIKDYLGKEINFDYDLLNNSVVKIFGNDNKISLTLQPNQTAEELLHKQGFSIFVNGNNNSIEMGHFNNVYNPITGAIGINIGIGGYLPFERTDNCTLKIGNNNMFYGVYISLKDNNSSITIGDDCLISWCNHIWCTDGHTLTDLDGKPINHGKKIEIGNHVWIGKDVKIGKNTKISDNSVVGWGSVVSKKFNKKNVVIAGNPAKVVKENVNWNDKFLARYEEDFEENKKRA